MGKINDMFHGPYRRLAYFVLVTTVALLVLWITGPGHTFIHWGRAAFELHRQNKIIEMYEAENADLDKRIEMMKNDVDTLEKFAREQYHFAAPGEDVYIVE